MGSPRSAFTFSTACDQGSVAIELFRSPSTRKPDDSRRSFGAVNRSSVQTPTPIAALIKIRLKNWVLLCFILKTIKSRPFVLIETDQDRDANFRQRISNQNSMFGSCSRRKREQMRSVSVHCCFECGQLFETVVN